MSNQIPSGSMAAAKTEINNHMADANQHVTAEEKAKVVTIDQTYTVAEKAKVTAIDQVYTSIEKTKLAGVATNANNYSHPNHTGDVTSTGDGVTVIGDNKVTLAKMAQMLTACILGRNTVGTGNVEILSMATLKTMLGLNSAAYTASTAYAAAAHAANHVTGGSDVIANVVAAGNSGLMTGADKTKLDGIATNANNYVHPTTDGSKHVPATGTTNDGKVLTAGATAGTFAWEAIPASGNTVLGLTGTIANGATIPLPSGFTHAQCVFQVFLDSVSVSVNSEGAASATVNTSTRVVTITNSANVSCTARYIIIGVK